MPRPAPVTRGLGDFRSPVRDASALLPGGRRPLVLRVDAAVMTEIGTGVGVVPCAWGDGQTEAPRSRQAHVRGLPN
jgi:hypothetical protein